MPWLSRILLVLALLAQGHAALFCPAGHRVSTHRCCSGGQCKGKCAGGPSCHDHRAAESSGCQIRQACCDGKSATSPVAGVEYLGVDGGATLAPLVATRLLSHPARRGSPDSDEPPHPPPRA